MTITLAETYLKKYFGYSRFREVQQQVIESILQGKDTFGIMPTGGGKSICYQIPALIMEGITVVISPLISLMKDQVDALRQVGIPAIEIHSALPLGEVHDRLTKVKQGRYKLLYIAPERLESPTFLKTLQALPVSLVAIDEAHCISIWGHDFRPSYRYIPQMLAKLSNKPVVVALTATATREVQEDILTLFSIPRENAYLASFQRENLIFAVRQEANKRQFLLDFLHKRRHQTGIIYASSRRTVDQLYHYLAEQGYRVAKYHAGLDDRLRKQAQERFAHDRVHVMIATSAFGMGIDKSNIRYVIHYHMPRDLESYYQEAGRAGRDGLVSDCVLLYQPKDIRIHRYLIEQSELSAERKQLELKKLWMMDQYGRAKQCLSNFFIRYFGEQVSHDCGRCQNCLQKEHGEKKDFTLEAQKIFSCIKRMNERFGLGMVAKVLVGSKNKQVRQFGLDRISTYGILSEYTQKRVRSMCYLLVSEGYIRIGDPTSHRPIARLTPKAAEVLRGHHRVFLYDQAEIPANEREQDEEESLFEKLRQLRKALAEKEGIPPYLIFHDSVLKQMCQDLPVDSDQMRSMIGVGEKKWQKYGNDFLSVLRDASKRKEAATQKKLPVVKSYALDQVRAKHRNAYQPWSKDEEDRLTRLFDVGKPMEEIAHILGRPIGGIRSRLEKLGFIEPRR